MRFWLRSASVLLALCLKNLYAGGLSFTPVDLREHYQFTSFEARITLWNNNASAVRIIGMEALRKSDRVRELPESIKSGESAVAVVQISTDDDAGSAVHSFRITTDSGDPQVVQFRNFGLTVLDTARPNLDLGVIQAGELPKPSHVLVNGSLDADLKLRGVEQVPDFVTVKIVDGNKLEISPNTRANWGFHSGFVRVALSSSYQRSAAIGVQLNVHGDVVPSENPMSMGIVRKGGDSPHLNVLRTRNGSDFEIADVNVSGLQATAATQPCQPEAKGCRTIALKLDDAQPTGRLSGDAQIRFKGRPEVLDIALSAILVAADTKIIPLDLAAQESGVTLTSDGKVDLKSALSDAARSTSDTGSVPPGNGPLLKWKMENDWQLHGYFVFRSETEAGPYQCATPSAIISEAPMQAGAVTRYWRDTDAVAGRTYWYYVASIGMDGRMQQLTGPQKVVAK